MPRNKILGSLRSKVIARDRSICQYCYRATKKPEVHHIRPVYIGGADDLCNLIVLCSTCHKYAPNNEEEFLAYQKDGGAGFAFILKDLLKLQSVFFPDATMQETQDSINEYRIDVFQNSWKYNESIYLDELKRIDKKQLFEDQRNALVSSIRENVKDWISRKDLFALDLPYLTEARLTHLVKSGLLLKDKIPKDGETVVHYKPADCA